MKFGIRIPSLSKRISARTSPARFIRHSLGFKVPRGFGLFTNPKRAIYNKIYNRTTVKADGLIILAITILFALIGGIFSLICSLFRSTPRNDSSDHPFCPRCNSPMVIRIGRKGKFFGCSSFPHCRGTRDYLVSNKDSS
jgi:hypothetical protein